MPSSLGRVLLFGFLVCLAQAGWAGTLLVTTGSQTYEENEADQNTSARRTNFLSVGAGWQAYWMSFEQSEFSNSSTTGSISIERKVQTRMLSILRVSDLCRLVCPFWGAGVGAQTEDIDTRLSGITTTDRARQNLIAMGALGVQADIPWLWLSLELRALGFERANPNPSPALLGRLGIYF